MPQILISNFIRQLNELENGSLWFDQSFKDKFDKLLETEALTRPLPQIHCVAEHVSHMLEWRKECVCRFQGTKIDLMDSPDDWKENDELGKIGWATLKNSLYKSRSELIDLIADQDDNYLKTKFLDTDYDFHYLMEGIIHHDLYHLGQIGITLKLLSKTN